MERKNMKATIFTTKTCGFCPMVKRWLDYKGISYTEIDINEHPEEAPHDILTVPVTILNGHKIVGYNLQSLSEALL